MTSSLSILSYLSSPTADYHEGGGLGSTITYYQHTGVVQVLQRVGRARLRFRFVGNPSNSENNQGEVLSGSTRVRKSTVEEVVS